MSIPYIQGIHALKASLLKTSQLILINYVLQLHIQLELSLFNSSIIISDKVLFWQQLTTKISDKCAHISSAVVFY